MKHLDLTLPTAAANLALDEALLDWCDLDPANQVLRFWEPRQYFVVVGYANRVESEVNTAACRERAIPVLRRCSGGGTVLQGPGCLNYSLVLGIAAGSPLQSITGTNRYVMERHRDVLSGALDLPVRVKGFTDLAVGDLKFSGNAQRRKRNALIFHGTFLVDFDIDLVERVLHRPSKEPDYRQGRSHRQFLTNLRVSSLALKSALLRAWGAKEALQIEPGFSLLLEGKYSSDEWNLKF